MGKAAQPRVPRGTPRADVYLDHLRKAPPYDVAKLTHADLVNYALFWYTFDDDRKAVEAIRRLLAEKPDHPDLPELALTCFVAPLRGGFDPDVAEKLTDVLARTDALSKAIDAAKAELADPEDGEHQLTVRARIAELQKLKRDLPLHRAHVLAFGKGRFDEALEVLDGLVKKHLHGESGAEQAFGRRALIAKGDVLLLQAKYKDAEKVYREAERLDPRQMTRAQKMTRIGGYPFRVADYLSRDLHRYALETIDDWEDILPVAKLEGETFYLRGKVMYLGWPSVAAVKYLELSERVNPSAPHVPEAAWLKANCLLAIGHYQEALAAFGRIQDELTNATYLKLIPEKIEQCRAGLAGAATRRAGEKGKGG